MRKRSIKFYWGDTLLEMLPSRALFLPETKELLICDIHLGKAEYFQQNGIPHLVWNSKIDNLRIWDIALSSSEILNNDNSHSFAYWNFNEGSGNTVTDLSGNGNNGTISGATWSTDAPVQYTNNCTATDDVVVTVNPLPNIDLGTDTTLICAGTSETLDAGTGFTSYLWK